MDSSNDLERPIPADATPIEALAIILACPPDALPTQASMQNHAQWDSFAQVELMTYLGDRYQIEFTEANLVRYSTLSALQSLLNQSAG